MKFHQANSNSCNLYIPDGTAPAEALARTTHLAIGAHQDDLEIFAYHGIAECFGQKDKWFTGVTVTDGGGSSRTGIYANYTDEDMKAVRLEEQRKAAYIGEYAAQIQLAYPSSIVKDKTDTTVADDLLAIVRATKPDYIYLHNPADKHSTHIGVLGKCIKALRQLNADERPKALWGCEVWRDLDWVPDAEKVALPCGLYPNLAAALLGVFDSQITGGKRYDLAAIGRRLANATFYESHATDKDNALTWAIDLMPLLENPELSLSAFTEALVGRFQQDVRERIGAFAG